MLTADAKVFVVFVFHFYLSRLSVKASAHISHFRFLGTRSSSLIGLKPVFAQNFSNFPVAN